MANLRENECIVNDGLVAEFYRVYHRIQCPLLASIGLEFLIRAVGDSNRREPIDNSTDCIYTQRHSLIERGEIGLVCSANGGSDDDVGFSQQ